MSVRKGLRVVLTAMACVALIPVGAAAQSEFGGRRRSATMCCCRAT